ncbi:hypothetical protein DY000_02026817 [Brassica cretica]|uniref:Uncharacterized protein n=1 Tax=Brassica cretica TaxID=69181 RepID=A0ABQ7E7M9_BRACR|nr:hypothetical protein DY000_02026817 [Brassica cretica]
MDQVAGIRQVTSICAQPYFLVVYARGKLERGEEVKFLADEISRGEGADSVCKPEDEMKAMVSRLVSKDYDPFHFAHKSMNMEISAPGRGRIILNL